MGPDRKAVRGERKTRASQTSRLIRTSAAGRFASGPSARGPPGRPTAGRFSFPCAFTWMRPRADLHLAHTLHAVFAHSRILRAFAVFSSPSACPALRSPLPRIRLVTWTTAVAGETGGAENFPRAPLHRAAARRFSCALLADQNFRRRRCSASLRLKRVRPRLPPS